MMIEVMMSQRGYRMVYYGIINLISTILFLYPSFNGNDNTLDKSSNGAIFFIIILVYLFEAIYFYPLIIYTIKYWRSIDYGMGDMSVLHQIFFWRLKFNYIMIISYITILISCLIFIKLL